MPGGAYDDAVYPVYPAGDISSATSDLQAAIATNQGAVGQILLGGYTPTNTLINGNTLAIQSLGNRGKQITNGLIGRNDKKVGEILNAALNSTANQVAEAKVAASNIPGLAAQQTSVSISTASQPAAGPVTINTGGQFQVWQLPDGTYEIVNTLGGLTGTGTFVGGYDSNELAQQEVSYLISGASTPTTAPIPQTPSAIVQSGSLPTDIWFVIGPFQYYCAGNQAEYRLVNATANGQPVAWGPGNYSDGLTWMQSQTVVYGDCPSFPVEPDLTLWKGQQGGLPTGAVVSVQPKPVAPAPTPALTPTPTPTPTPAPTPTLGTTPTPAPTPTQLCPPQCPPIVDLQPLIDVINDLIDTLKKPRVFVRSDDSWTYLDLYDNLPAAMQDAITEVIGEEEETVEAANVAVSGTWDSGDLGDNKETEPAGVPAGQQVIIDYWDSLGEKDVQDKPIG